LGQDVSKRDILASSSERDISEGAILCKSNFGAMPEFITIHTDDEYMKSKHAFGILSAIEAASKSTMICRHGCVLVKSKKHLINIGYNKQPIHYNKNKRSIHAEVLCCTTVPKTILNGLTLYIAHINHRGLIAPCKCCQDCVNYLNKTKLKTVICYSA